MRLTPHRLKPCTTESLTPGDHVAVRRREGYTHHGIFLGKDRVAHFSDEGGMVSKSRARVKETSMDEFLRGGALLRRRHRRELPPHQIVARARAVVRGERDWKPYHLMRNNCEHFATYCVTREARSIQVRYAAGLVAVSTLAYASTSLTRRLRRGY